jgi:hypothetical protein
MPRIPLALLCLGLLPLSATRAAAQSLPPSDAVIEEVVVTGEYPGPGLWKITRPDDAAGHVLWIAGDPWPLPKRLKWKSREIESIAASAQEILRDASVTLNTDEKIGLLRGMTLMPSVLKARRNPGEARLEDVLPPALYARWKVQKKLYLGRDAGVERFRPIFAAGKLRKEAFDDLGMRESGAVWEVVGELAKTRKIKVTQPLLTFTFPRDQVRGKLKEFAQEPLADVECFATTLDLTEALARAEVERARAQAWATGDVDALTSMPALPNPSLACVTAVMNAQVAREVLPADIRDQVFKLWMDAAEKALAANQTTFAVVPFAKLTRPEGYLAAFRAKGYLVEEPR